VDLQQWIAQDHAFVLARFDSAIGNHVPVQRSVRTISRARSSPSTMHEESFDAWVSSQSFANEHAKAAAPDAKPESSHAELLSFEVVDFTAIA